MKTQACKLISYLLLASFAIGAIGCNTMKGAGRDVEKAGEGIQKEAEKHD